MRSLAGTSIAAGSLTSSIRGSEIALGSLTISDADRSMRDRLDRGLASADSTKVMAVLRAGAGLGVVLHREDRLAPDRQAFVRPVEQREMRRRDPFGQAVGIDDEAVVLAGDLDLAGGEVLDRLIGAAMAAVELVG